MKIKKYYNQVLKKFYSKTTEHEIVIIGGGAAGLNLSHTHNL
jgi:NADH dehydrogenase FAD-containing subunit